MICPSCKFENREGALFCAECGKPLASANANAERTVILDQVVTNNQDAVEKVDDSEANTTVLTSDMLKPVQAAKPQGFVAGPAVPQAPKMAPQAAPMNGQPVQATPQAAPQAPKMAPQAAPMNGQPVQATPQAAPQAPKMAPQAAPMNGQPMQATPQAAPQAPKMAPQAAPMNGQPVQTTPQVAPQPKTEVEPEEKLDKKAAKKAAKKAKKEGKRGGSKAYVVISILLMLIMAGGLVAGYLYHDKKMDEATAEIEGLKASASDAQATISQKDSELAALYASSTDAQTTIADLQIQLAESQSALSTAQATASSYVSYDPLIAFVESETADSSTDMMVSDTVVYTTAGSTVQVYVYFPSQEGQLSYLVSDVAVADCTWGEEWVNGNVLPISIQALSAGDVTIEVTNDQNDISETIFVHVE